MARHRKPRIKSIISEETLERMAHILGNSSAAQQALNDLRRRRQAGQDPVCYNMTDNMLLVGPKGLEEILANAS